MNNNEQYLKVALAAAKKAGKIFMQGFGKPKEIEKKGGDYRNLVTEFDKKIERLIKNEILRIFPDHEILGEELGRTSSVSTDHKWIIDPIDGTTNFIQGIPACCISIALWDRQGPLVGVVFNPVTNQLFSATRNKGALLNGKKIHASSTGKLKYALGGVGWSRAASMGKELFFNLLPASRKTRALGSTAYQLCLVAQGAYDYYAVGGMHIWDIAASVLLINEAGGKVTDWQGQKLQIDSGKIIASNGLVHDELLGIIKKLWPNHWSV